jgi:hypothetical protein
MEGHDVLQGTVFVTGPTDEATDSTPVPDSVVRMFELVEKIWRESHKEEA